MTDDERKYVYCSGPLFCPEELRVMEEIAACLERDGYGTFLPHRDGLEAFIMNSVNSQLVNRLTPLAIQRFISKATFALDIFQIVERCDYFVFNMNGRVPDEGGVVEAAVAFASGKPVVIYKSDRRSVFDGDDSCMIAGASCDFATVDEIEKIPPALSSAISRMESFGEGPCIEAAVPPYVKEVTDLGRRVWRILSKVLFLRPRNSLVS